MKKVIHSYYVGVETSVGDMRKTLHTLTAEYAQRKDAEAALKKLQESVPGARVYEWQARYDIDDPSQLRDYQYHVSRLL